MRKQVLSAGVVIVRQQTGQWHYLLLRAYNYWDFPKGVVEPGEQPLDGARREVAEETTLCELQFHWGRQYRETPPYNRGKVARYYLAECPTGDVSLPVNEDLGRPEHEEFRWVDYHTGWQMVSPRVKPVLAWARRIIEASRESSS